MKAQTKRSRCHTRLITNTAFTPLQVADFADIFTGRLITEIPDALRALCDALVDHESLVEINLSDNAFGGRSAEPMVNFLANNHHFQVLKLNNNGLGIQGGTIVANALIDAAKKITAAGKTSNLRTVICGRNRLENGSAPVWAEAFKLHGGLKEVRMFQNGIRMEGIEAISKGLSHCKTLEVLDLQDNTATVKGSRAIAAALPSWPNLKTLNLSDMLLKPKGGQVVLATLAKGHNTNLETLQLQYDDIDRKGLELLGPAISRHLSKLTKLEINGNWADEEDDCITAIKSALEAHGHEDALDELDEMDPEGEESEAEDEDEDGEEAESDEDKAVDKEVDTDADKVTPAVVVGAGGAAVVGTAAAAGAVKKDDDAVISGGPSGTTAEGVTSDVPKSEPVTAVPAPSAPEAAAAPTTTAESATTEPTADATSSVTDDLVSEAKQQQQASSSSSVPASTAPADVAAEVSKSAQAVPERSEQIEQTTEVAQSAEVVHQQDDKEQRHEEAVSAASGDVAADSKDAGDEGVAVADSNDVPADKAPAVAASAVAAEENASGAATNVPVPTAAAVAADDDPAVQDVTTQLAAAKVDEPEVKKSEPEPAQEPAVGSSSASTAPAEQQAAKAKEPEQAAKSVDTPAALPTSTTSRSVDLNKELYSSNAGPATPAEGTSADGAAPATTTAAAADAQHKKKKSGFKGAFGAIKELLFR